MIYKCPPAKAIGAIGLREDTSPDIVVLVEDSMAKSLFFSLLQKYISMKSDASYLDIRILEIGGFANVINFWKETNDYIFYDNIYVTAFMDKDVETDIIPYSQYSNFDLIREYNENSHYLHFLPFTPECLLVRVFNNNRDGLLEKLREIYCNQQITYNVVANLDFVQYNKPFPAFTSQTEYNDYIKERGSFRRDCKEEAERIVAELSHQLNVSKEEIVRAVFKYSVDVVLENEINIMQLLASTMNRIRR